MSVVVPPTSITMASHSPVRNAAPRMLLVGPDPKVRTGVRAAYAADVRVPSFWLTYSGARMPISANAAVEGLLSRSRPCGSALHS